MMLSPDGPPALPLWINGRSFLTVVPEFFEIQHALTGEPLRRTPLCGTEEVAEAVISAESARAEWAELPQETRAAKLGAWAALLEQYADHFAKLIREETGKTETAALAEVHQAITALAHPTPSNPADHGKILALAWDDSAPLAQAAQLLAPVLLAGGAVILKPSPKAPGAAYALLELSSQNKFPPGVLNLVQGDEQALKAMLHHSSISRLVFSGRQDLVTRIIAIAKNGTVPCSTLIYTNTEG